MELTVYGPLRSATDSKRVEVTSDCETVADLLAAFSDAYPRARSQLYDGDGDLRPSVRVTVDGETAGLDEQVPPGAEIKLFPAMRGG